MRCCSDGPVPSGGRAGAHRPAVAAARGSCRAPARCRPGPARLRRRRAAGNRDPRRRADRSVCRWPGADPGTMGPDARVAARRWSTTAPNADCPRCCRWYSAGHRRARIRKAAGAAGCRRGGPRGHASPEIRPAVRAAHRCAPPAALDRAGAAGRGLPGGRCCRACPAGPRRRCWRRSGRPAHPRPPVPSMAAAGTGPKRCAAGS